MILPSPLVCLSLEVDGGRLRLAMGAGRCHFQWILLSLLVSALRAWPGSVPSCAYFLTLPDPGRAETRPFPKRAPPLTMVLPSSLCCLVKGDAFAFRDHDRRERV